MEILPGVRRRLMRRRTEKILQNKTAPKDDPAELGALCQELSIEGFVGQKLDNFFKRLGHLEADGLYDVVLSQVERPLIEKALHWAGGNQLKASRILGVNRNTLRAKMRRHKIKAGQGVKRS